MVEEYLRLLRDHPWLSVSQVAGLLGISMRTAYRHMALLMDEGLVQKTRVHFPDVRSDLYALSAQGMRYLAGKEDLVEYGWKWGCDPWSLGRALVRIRRLSWARDLLAVLCRQGGCRLRWAVSPPPASLYGTLIDVVALVEVFPGKASLLQIGADIGGMPVGRLVRRIPAAGGGVLVIVTTPERADFWTWWRDSRRVEAMVLSVPLGKWEISGVLNALRHVASPDDVPFPRRRYRRSPFPPGSVLLDGRWGGNAVLDVFRKMTSDEWLFLNAVVSWPFPVWLVSRMLGWTPQRTSSVVCRLERKGLVARKGDFLVPRLGLAVLGVQWGMPVHLYGPVRGWHGESHVSWRASGHSRLVALVGAGFKDLEIRMREKGLPHALIAWDVEMAIPRASGRDVVPDAVGIYRAGERVYRFLVEVERSSASRLVRKLAGYQQTGIYYERLLAICASPSQVRNVLEASRGLIGLSGRLGVASLVDLADGEAIDVGRPVWWFPGRDRPTFCFPEIGEGSSPALLWLELADLDREIQASARRSAGQKRRWEKVRSGRKFCGSVL